jgi:hypothetical protein
MIPRNATLDRTGEASGFLRRRGNMMVRRRRRLQFLSRGLTRVALLAALALTAAWGVERAHAWLVTTESLTVTRLEVVGTRHADQESVRGLAAGALEKNLFALDLERVVADVRRHPWVASAVVQRHLPDSLVIEVVERTPCALAVMEGQVLVLDTRGVAIDRYGPRFAEWSLPVFRGLDTLDAEVGYERSRRAAGQLEALRTQHPDFFGRPRNLAEYRALRNSMFQEHGSIHHVDLRWQGRVVATPMDGDSG